MDPGQKPDRNEPGTVENLAPGPGSQGRDSRHGDTCQNPHPDAGRGYPGITAHNRMGRVNG